MTRSDLPAVPVPLLPVLGAGWRFPVALDRPGTALEMAVDEACVRQSIELILSTRKGERAMRPDFGCDLGKLLFAPDNAATRAAAADEVTQALEAWEPRIELLEVQVRSGEAGAGQLLVDVRFRVRSTDNRFNLVYPFYLDRALT